MPSSSSLADLGPSLRKFQAAPFGRLEIARLERDTAPALPLRFGKLDEALPDGGLPRGAVVEIASPYGLARASSIALAACSAAQAEAKQRGDKGSSGAWCAWIEAHPSAPVSGPQIPGGSLRSPRIHGDSLRSPGKTTSSRSRPSLSVETSLFAPAVARAGVDLGRLLVVRPAPADVSRIAARTAQSHVFSVIVIDLVGVPGHHADARLDRWVAAVRRLAMAVEGTETTVILLTDTLTPRAVPLPVALRLELDRPSTSYVRLAVAKDRRGRVARAVPVMLPVESAPATSRAVA